MEAGLGQAQLVVVRTLVGDPAGVDRGHEDAVGLEHLLRAGPRDHVHGRLRGVGVRVPGALVAAPEDAFHRRDVDDVRTAAGGLLRGVRHRRAQGADQDERRRVVAQLGLQQLDRRDLVDGLHPGVGVHDVGDETARVDGGAVEVPGDARVARDEREVGDLLRVQAAGAYGQRGDAVDGAGVEGADDVVGGQLTGGQRGALALDQGRVGGGQTAHGLRRVVDQDVQGPGLGDPLGQGHGLRRVAQVDADDLQPVHPVRRVVHGLEPADGVLGEARGDGRVGAVTQQPQRDVHADLGTAAGEQRALAGQVGSGVALGAVQAGAVRTELVVEVVDLDVAGLACVAGAGALEYARDPARLGDRRRQDALGLVVDALGGTGRGGLGDRLVVGGLGGPALLAAALLDRAVDAGRGPAHRDGVGVVDLQRVEFLEHAEADGQALGVDAGAVLDLVHGRRAVLCHRHRAAASLVTRAALRLAPAFERGILRSTGPLGQTRSAQARQAVISVCTSAVTARANTSRSGTACASATSP